MTIDKIRLKKLAEAATQGPWCWDKGEDPRPHTYGIATDADPECMVVNQDFGIEMKEDAYFIAAASPSTVLALLAEIERLEKQVDTLADLNLSERKDAEALQGQRDQLKAGNEALRSGQAINRLSCAEVREAFNGAYYQPREIGSDGEQCRAGVLAVIAAAVAKEVSHG